MWKKPWRYKEGFICGAGLFVTGLLLQWSVGDYSLGLVCVAGQCHCSGGVPAIAWQACMDFVNGCICFGWLSHYTAAVSSLVCVAVITVIMGLVRQVPSTHAFGRCHRLFEDDFVWPFVLLYFWMVTALGLTILRAGIPFRIAQTSFSSQSCRIVCRPDYGYAGKCRYATA